MVKPCERSGDFLYFRCGHFIRDAITLYNANRIFQKPVAILYGNIFEIDRIFGAIKQAVLIDVDAIVLHVAQIDGISSYITNQLSYCLGAEKPTMMKAVSRRVARMAMEPVRHPSRDSGFFISSWIRVD